MIYSKYLKQETDVIKEVEKDKKEIEKGMLISGIITVITIISLFLPIPKGIALISLCIGWLAIGLFLFKFLFELISIKKLEKDDLYEKLINKEYREYNNEIFFTDKELLFPITSWSDECDIIKYSDINEIKVDEENGILLITLNNSAGYEIPLGNKLTKEDTKNLIEDIKKEIQSYIANIKVSTDLHKPKDIYMEEEIEKVEKGTKNNLIISIIISLIVVLLNIVVLKCNIIKSVDGKAFLIMISSIIWAILFIIIILNTIRLISIIKLKKDDFYEKLINKHYKIYADNLGFKMYFTDTEIVNISDYLKIMKKIEYENIKKIDAKLYEVGENGGEWNKRLIIIDKKGRKIKTSALINPSSKQSVIVVKEIVNDLKDKVPNVGIGENIFSTEPDKYYNLKKWLWIIGISFGFVLLGVLGKVISILL